MIIKKLYAKIISYKTNGTKPVLRDLNDIKYIVIHNTGNKGDTARNNAMYFHTTNTREAGAHYFIDRKGEIYKSCKMQWIAWAVGGNFEKKENGSKYYGKCNNSNSVSIELCDIVDKDISPLQLEALQKLIKNIQEKCPNAKTIIRHFDVNSKECPIRYIDEKKWKKLKNSLKG